MRARREVILARLADLEVESLAAEMSHNGDGNEFDDGIDDNGVPELPWLREAVPAPMPLSPPEQQREDEQDWPDDESVRPDIAQFYLYAPSDSGDGDDGPDSGRSVIARRRRTPDAPHDERSTYTYSYSGGGGDARGDIESYYFGDPDIASDYGSAEGGADNSTADSQSRASFVDDERSREMRQRFLARVDALYGPDKVPPVPRLRPF